MRRALIPPLLACLTLTLAGAAGSERDASFVDLGFGLAGSFGFVPVLAGAGVPAPGDSVTLTLSKAAKSSLAFLFLGGHSDPTPLLGGTLVPASPVVVSGIPTRKGLVILSGRWPAGMQPGDQVFAQYWILDNAAVQGYSASNALMITGS